MINKLYEKTKGYKTVAGFIVAFIAGGLSYTGIIDEEAAKQLVLMGTYIVAFGLGDKVGNKLG